MIRTAFVARSDELHKVEGKHRNTVILNETNEFCDLLKTLCDAHNAFAAADRAAGGAGSPAVTPSARSAGATILPKVSTQQHLWDEFELNARERRRQMMAKLSKDGSGDENGSDNEEDDGGESARKPDYQTVKNMRLVHARRRRLEGKKPVVEDPAIAARERHQREKQEREREQREQVHREKQEQFQRERQAAQRLLLYIREACIEVAKQETFDRASVSLDEQAQRSVLLYTMSGERQVVLDSIQWRRAQPPKPSVVAMVSPTDSLESASRPNSPAPQAPPASLMPEMPSSPLGSALGTQQTPPAEDYEQVIVVPDALEMNLRPAQQAAAIRQETLFVQDQDVFKNAEGTARETLLKSQWNEFKELVSFEQSSSDAIKQHQLEKYNLLQSALSQVASACSSPAPSVVSSNHRAIESTMHFRQARQQVLVESLQLMEHEESGQRLDILDDEVTTYQSSIALLSTLITRKLLSIQEAQVRKSIENVQEKTFIVEVMSLHKYFAAVEDLLPNFVAAAELILIASKKEIDDAGKKFAEIVKRIREVSQTERVQRVDIVSQEEECRELIDRYRSNTHVCWQNCMSKGLQKEIYSVESQEMVTRLMHRGFEEWAWQCTCKLNVVAQAQSELFASSLQNLMRVGANAMRTAVTRMGHSIQTNEDAYRDEVISVERELRQASAFAEKCSLIQIGLFEAYTQQMETHLKAVSQSTTDFFTQLQCESIDVRQAVTTVFFNTEQSPPSFHQIDCTTAPFTQRTLQLLLNFVGRNRCAVHRLVVRNAPPSACRLISIHASNIFLVNCAITDDDLISTSEPIVQKGRDNGTATFISPLECLVSRARSAKETALSITFSGNKLGEQSFEKFMQILKMPSCHAEILGVEEGNDAISSKQKNALVFMTSLNRSLRREIAVRDPAAAPTDESTDAAFTESQSLFRSFGKADIAIVAAFRTLCIDVISPSNLASAPKQGVPINLTKYSLPRQSGPLQELLTVFLRACHFDSLSYILEDGVDKKYGVPRTPGSIGSLDLSGLGLSDTDIPLFKTTIFNSELPLLARLQRINFSSNFFSKRGIDQLHQALKTSNHYNASSFMMFFDGNLNSLDVNEHEAAERHKIVTAEQMIVTPIFAFGGYERDFVASATAFTEEKSFTVQPHIEQLLLAVDVSRLITRKLHAVIFDENVERRTLQDSFASAQAKSFRFSTLMGNLTQKVEENEQNLLREFKQSVLNELALSELAIKKFVYSRHLIDAFSRDIVHFTRYHDHIVLLDSFVSVEFLAKCANVLNAGEDKFSEIRSKLFRQPQALRDAVYKTMQPLRFFEAAEKQSLDLSRSDVGASPPFRDHLISNSSISIIAELIRDSHATPHPIRSLSLRNCQGLIEMDSALPVLLSLCPMLDSIDLSNSGLSSRHVELICQTIATHSPEYSLENSTDVGLLKSIDVSGNTFTLADMHRLLSELKDSNLQKLNVGDETRGNEMPMRNVLDLCNFYSELNSKNNSAFKSKLLAIARDDPFYQIASFDLAVPVRSTTRSATPLQPYSPTRRASSRERPDSSSTSQHSSPMASPTKVMTKLIDPATTESSTVLDDESIGLLLFALSFNTNLKHLSLVGNRLTDAGVNELIEFLAPRIETSSLTSIDLWSNPCSVELAETAMNLFTSKNQILIKNQVIQPEEEARGKLSSQLFQQFQRSLREYYYCMSDWLKATAAIYQEAQTAVDKVVAVAFKVLLKGLVAEEYPHREYHEQQHFDFSNVALEYFSLLSMIHPWAKHFTDLKAASMEEAADSLDTVRNIIRSLDPSIRAVAVHIARNNPYVDTLELTDAFGSKTDGNATVDAIAQLMKMNTHIRELSFANAGPFINSNRSIPLIAELGVRLETLDLTNCGVSDALIGSLAVMIADPKCQMKTLVLDGNKITAKGAQRLAKAIRSSGTLSLVSLENNPNLAREAQHIVRFYCDLNKFTPSFKETILRVEANDPTLLDIDFERRGNTDERTIFDDTSMRLLCAALPHNTHVQRLRISGNHVTDDGALALLSLLKANVNRTVCFVDLSGNDVSLEVLEEVERLQYFRMIDVIKFEVSIPENEARMTIRQEEHFFSSVVLLALFQHDMELQMIVDDYLIVVNQIFKVSSLAAAIYYRVVKREEQIRSASEIEEGYVRDLHRGTHFHVLTELNGIYMTHMRSVRILFGDSKLAVEARLEEIDRQPNEELRRQCFHIVGNDPRTTSLDLSAGSGRTTDDTIAVAMSLLQGNSTIRSMSISGNTNISREKLRQLLQFASTKLETLDLSYCNIGNDMMSAIEDVAFSPTSTLRMINLDGNHFGDSSIQPLINTYSTTTYARTSFSPAFGEFHDLSLQTNPLARVTVKNCPLVLESTQKSVEFYSELHQCPNTLRALVLSILSDDPVVVDAATILVTEDQLKLICLAISKVKRTKGLKLLGAGITDIGVSYLLALLRGVPHLFSIVIAENRSISSVARESFRQALQTRLQALLNDECTMPEEYLREDVSFEQSMILRYTQHYNAVASLVCAHHEQGKYLFVSRLGCQLAETSVLPTENVSRQAIAQHEQSLRTFFHSVFTVGVRIGDTFQVFEDSCDCLFATSRAQLEDIINRYLMKQCRELKWKAFAFALNDITVSTLNISGSWKYQSTVQVLNWFLKHNTQLKEINASSNDLPDLDAFLQCILSMSCCVTSLNLSNCGITDNLFVDVVIPFLEHPNCRVEKLQLDRNPLTTAALGALTRSLREKSHTICNVVSVKLIDEAPKELSSAYAYLVRLNQFVSRSKAAGGKREDYIRMKQLLVDCQQNKSYLTTLNFADDAGMQALVLDDEFIQMLCIALETNSFVRSVNIQNHQVTDRGAYHLFPIFGKETSSLQVALLDGNFVSAHVADFMLKILAFREFKPRAQEYLENATVQKELLFDSSSSLIVAVGGVASKVGLAERGNRNNLETLEALQANELRHWCAFLRFGAAWIKSYMFAFEKNFSEAKDTQPQNRNLYTLSKARSIPVLKRAHLPEELAERYVQYVTAVTMYEEKCFAALEHVFGLAAHDVVPAQRVSVKTAAALTSMGSPFSVRARSSSPMDASPIPASPVQQRLSATLPPSPPHAAPTSPPPAPLTKVSSILKNSSSRYAPSSPPRTPQTTTMSLGQMMSIENLMPSMESLVLQNVPGSMEIVDVAAARHVSPARAATPTADRPSSSTRFLRSSTPVEQPVAVEAAQLGTARKTSAGMTRDLPPRPAPSTPDTYSVEPDEATQLVQQTSQKLSARYEKYLAQVDNFQKKCLTVLESLYDQYATAANESLTASPSVRPPPEYSISLANDVLASKLEERYAKYTSGTAGFSAKCEKLKADMFEKASQPVLANIAQMKTSSGKASDEKLEQVYRILPTQPLDLQAKAHSIIDNDSYVTSLNLSQSTNGPHECTDITIGVLYTVLQGNRAVTDINFSGALKNISLASMKALLRVSLRLKYLDLTGMRCSDSTTALKFVMGLLSSKTLRTLILDDCDLTQETMAHVLSTLRTTNTTLCSISVKNNPTGAVDKNAIAFAVFYAECNKHCDTIPSFKDTITRIENQDLTMTHVSFAGNENFVDTSVRLVCIALTRNSSVKTVDFSGTAITDKAARFLSTLLKTSKSITSVSLQKIAGLTNFGRDEIQSSCSKTVSLLL